MSEVTLALQSVSRGERKATEELFPLVYEELRRMAEKRMAGEAAGHTLQPTALVHEAWLRLVGDKDRTWKNRAYFFGAVAEAMRRILREGARRRRAERHGGGQERVDVDDPSLVIAAPNGADDEMVAVHEALDRLQKGNARAAEVVKLKYFVGLTLDEAADVLGIAVPTAKRDWAYARAWLYKEIGQGRRQ